MKASLGSSPAASPARRRSRRQLDLQALLVQAVDERWQTYRRELKRCQKHYSEEAVHDLRVATRRLISVLEGGYELHALGRSVAAHLKVLADL